MPQPPRLTPWRACGGQDPLLQTHLACHCPLFLCVGIVMMLFVGSCLVLVVATVLDCCRLVVCLHLQFRAHLMPWFFFNTLLAMVLILVILLLLVTCCRHPRGLVLLHMLATPFLLATCTRLHRGLAIMATCSQHHRGLAYMAICSHLHRGLELRHLGMELLRVQCCVRLMVHLGGLALPPSTCHAMESLHVLPVHSPLHGGPLHW